MSHLDKLTAEQITLEAFNIMDKHAIVEYHKTAQKFKVIENNKEVNLFKEDLKQKIAEEYYFEERWTLLYEPNFLQIIEQVCFLTYLGL